MNILQPITITDDMIGAGTSLAEDTTPAWVSGTSYTVGQEVQNYTSRFSTNLCFGFDGRRLYMY